MGDSLSHLDNLLLVLNRRDTVRIFVIFCILITVYICLFHFSLLTGQRKLTFKIQNDIEDITVTFGSTLHING